MFKDLSPQAIGMGLLVAVVGFGSSFAVVLQGLTAIGASSAQAASGLMALSIAMGIGGILLSVYTRMPVSIAWSTPGAALLATGEPLSGGFATAIGGFVMCAVLLTLAGAWNAFGQLIRKIPLCLANAMLAGILFGLCLAPINAFAKFPQYTLPIVLTWLVVGRLHKLWATPAAFLCFLCIVIFVFGLPEQSQSGYLQTLVADPLWITPHFSLQGFINLAIPLFVVTMASQNIPGLTVLSSLGYKPNARPLLVTTGALSLFSAPFGGHAVNLAAITAALCAGEDAHPDPQRRYWAAIVAGAAYVVLGVLVGLVITLVTIAPPLLLQAVAGLALIGTCATALFNAFESSATRESAAITFFITASGITIAGISGAFWGLVVGGLVYSFSRRTSSA